MRLESPHRKRPVPAARIRREAAREDRGRGRQLERGEDNLLCLESLYAQVPPPDRVLFIDNDSQDGSWQRVAARFPRSR
jgi:hypothetical protein